MAEFTTEEIRDRFTFSFANTSDDRGRDFDLWLAGIQEKAVAEAQTRIASWFNATSRDISWSGSEEDQDDLLVLSSAENAVEDVLTSYRAELVKPPVPSE